MQISNMQSQNFGMAKFGNMEKMINDAIVDTVKYGTLAQTKKLHKAIGTIKERAPKGTLKYDINTGDVLLLEGKNSARKIPVWAGTKEHKLTNFDFLNVVNDIAKDLRKNSGRAMTMSEEIAFRAM